MPVVLTFDCGGTLECPRQWLLLSPVLECALGANDSDVHGVSEDQLSTLPIMHDKLEDWQLLMPYIAQAAELQASSTAGSDSSSIFIDLDFQAAATVLKIADKYNIRAICDMVEAFLSSDRAVYSQAPLSSGDPSSIWWWLHIASSLSQPSLLQHYKSTIISQRLVPNSAADVAGLHPTDLADLLMAFMRENAAVRYKCLGCAGRHSTEVRLCGRCSFSPHIRL